MGKNGMVNEKKSGDLGGSNALAQLINQAVLELSIAEVVPRPERLREPDRKGLPKDVTPLGGSCEGGSLYVIAGKRDVTQLPYHLSQG